VSPLEPYPPLHKHVDCPTANVPELSGQLLQVVAPVDEEYFPVLHAKQTEEEDAVVPVVVLYVPALH